MNIEVHGPELVSFDDTIAAIADAVGCGIPCRAGCRAVRDAVLFVGYRAVRDAVPFVGYRAVRDTVPCGIPHRAGYHAARDTTPGRPHPRLCRYPIAFNEVPPAAWRDALVGHGLPKVFAGTSRLQRHNKRNSATAQRRNHPKVQSCNGTTTQ